jgi:hypothetical protein
MSKKYPKKHYEIGRASFDVEVVDTPLNTPEEASKTLLGLALGHDPKLLKKKDVRADCQYLFHSTGMLRITVTGDPGAGIMYDPAVIDITGFRFGLDDVFIDGQLVQTVHRDPKDVIKYVVKRLERAESILKRDTNVKKIAKAKKELIRFIGEKKGDK